MAEIEDVWRLLAAAVSERTALTALQLATVGEDGAPGVRAVIVRGFDPDAGALALVTHAASPKARAIAADPRVALAGYDPATDVQLRLEGTADIVVDPAARDAMWATLRRPTREMFLGALAPGTELGPDAGAHPAPAGPLDAPTPWFCLIAVAIERAELLELALEPHSRTRFCRAPAGWTRARVAP